MVVSDVDEVLLLDDVELLLVDVEEVLVVVVTRND